MWSLPTCARGGVALNLNCPKGIHSKPKGGDIMQIGMHGLAPLRASVGRDLLARIR